MGRAACVAHSGSGVEGGREGEILVVVRWEILEPVIPIIVVVVDMRVLAQHAVGSGEIDGMGISIGRCER